VTAPLVIVGAGVAGLSLGLALKRQGLEPLILERRSDLTAEGAGVQIGPNGTRILQWLGALEAVEPHASKPSSIHVHDGATGGVLTRLPLGDWIAARHGAPYWVVHRADLVRALLATALKAGIDIRFGVEVERVHAATSGVAVELRAGAPITAAGVIGADGVWSVLRQQVFGGVAPVLAGRVAARLLLTGSVLPALRRDVVSVWMAPNAHLVAYPVQRAAAVNVVLVSHGNAADQRWSSEVSVDALRQRFTVFPEELRALASVEGWRQWPLVSLAPLPRYAQGRVALIGDAAHPMQPFLAQGAVMAMEDAAVMAQCLSSSSNTIAEAFSAFSTARHVRTQRVVAAAERNGRIYHLRGAAAVARNTVLRLSPPEMIMRGYDWLYGGAPDMDN
jgi:salicylate hydroxylase